MIPMDQQDYIKYRQALKGNYVKGAQLLESLLELADVGPAVASSAPAAAAVFAGCGSSNYDKCLNAVSSSEYKEKMLLTYLNSGAGTSFTELSAALEDDTVIDFIIKGKLAYLPIGYTDYRDVLLSARSLQQAYGRDESYSHFYDSVANMQALSISAGTVSIGNYSTVWDGTYVPEHNKWYLGGWYTPTANAYVNAAIWSYGADGTTPARVWTGDSRYQVLALEYNDTDKRLYAFLNYTTSNSATEQTFPSTNSPTSATDNTTLLVFSTAGGTLTLVETIPFSSYAEVYFARYDPKRGKMVCCGFAASSTSTYPGSVMGVANTQARSNLFVAYGDVAGGWTVKYLESYSTASSYWCPRALSYEPQSGNFMMPIYNVNVVVFDTEGNLNCLLFDTTSSYYLSHSAVPYGKNRWLVGMCTSDYTSSAAYTRPYRITYAPGATSASASAYNVYYTNRLIHLAPYNLTIIANLNGTTEGTWLLDPIKGTNTASGYSFSSGTSYPICLYSILTTSSIQLYNSISSGFKQNGYSTYLAYFRPKYY